MEDACKLDVCSMLNKVFFCLSLCWHKPASEDIDLSSIAEDHTELFLNEDVVTSLTGVPGLWFKFPNVTLETIRLSKLLTYCVFRPTQPPTFSGTGNESRLYYFI